MLKILRKIIPENSPIRLFYSWSKSYLAKTIYWNPSKNICVIGITGTDGKTTTCHFTAELLEKLGMKVVMSSTEEIWINWKYKNNKTKRTTLSPFIIQKILKDAVDEKCKVAIIEVSSHAITQKRIAGIDFNWGIITNISQEHCNYHKNIEAYAKTKAKLFKIVNNSKKSNKFLIVNENMKFKKLFSEVNPQITQTYALWNKNTNITVYNTKLKKNKSTFTLRDNNKNKEIQNTVLNISGTYNIENILSSILVAQKFWFKLETISKHIKEISPISGRLELINTNSNFDVYIDFAVTPWALEQTLTYLKQICNRDIFIVFGCTWANHDHSKRPMMGEITSRLADFVILTEDETYGEDNNKIMEDIEKWFEKKFIAYKKINDREKAINFALKNASNNDIVIITGMWAFTSRNNGIEEIKWSDKKVVEKYFEQC